MPPLWDSPSLLDAELHLATQLLKASVEVAHGAVHVTDAMTLLLKLDTVAT
jgi:hypothetical protein